MTRKRFIHLLMAKGCQRNEANLIAKSVNEPYAIAWERMFFKITIDFDSENFKEQVQYAMDAIIEFVRKIPELMCAKYNIDVDERAQ